MSTNAIRSEPKNLRREHNVVSQEEWIAARKELLRKEKESTRLRDQLSAEQRQLPWVKVEKSYATAARLRREGAALFRPRGDGAMAAGSPAGLFRERSWR